MLPQLASLAAAGLVELDDETGASWIRTQLQGGALGNCQTGLEAAMTAGRNLELIARGVPHYNQGRFLA